MVFKIENCEININGKSIVKTFIVGYMLVKLCKTMGIVNNKYYTTMIIPTKEFNKKQKAESN